MPLKRTPPKSSPKAVTTKKGSKDATSSPRLSPNNTPAASSSGAAVPPASQLSQARHKVSTAPMNLPHFGSTPELSALEHLNVAACPKRKRDDDDSGSLLDEVRMLITASLSKQAQQFEEIKGVMTDISSQNREIKESMAFISKQYEEIKDKVISIEEERKADRQYIDKLEEKIEKLEKQAYSKKLEIKNIPKKPTESKRDICEIVSDLAKLVDVPLEGNEISDIFRVRAKGDKDNSKQPSIIVEFNSSIRKEEFLAAVRHFNKFAVGPKLNTSHLNMDPPAKPIFISECLTLNTQKLFYQARTFAKENAFKYCWTSSGIVYLRKTDGVAHTRVNTCADLDKILQK